MWKCAVLAAAAMLSACATGADGDSISIPSGVWSEFQTYKDRLKPSDEMYFAVSWDGGWAANNDKHQVLSSCQEVASATCVLFAHNDKILVPYHLR